MTKPKRYKHKEKYIFGQRHLLCRREYAEGDKTFCIRCENTVSLRFASLYYVALIVKEPEESCKETSNPSK